MHLGDRMKERGARLRAIRQLVMNLRIESQEILLDELSKQGFSVTQATLSRDLKFLKIGKLADGNDGYHYGLPGTETQLEWEQTYIQDLERGWISIEFSGNVAVVKTLPAHADTVAIALDNLPIDELMGTIAGDDTILLVLRDGANKSVFLEQLRSIAPDLMV